LVNLVTIENGGMMPGFAFPADRSDLILLAKTAEDDKVGF